MNHAKRLQTENELLLILLHNLGVYNLYFDKDGLKWFGRQGYGILPWRVENGVKQDGNPEKADAAAEEQTADELSPYNEGYSAGYGAGFDKGYQAGTKATRGDLALD